MLGDGGDDQLIVTSELEDAVRANWDPAYAAAFVQDRGNYGTVMGKTLPQDDGHCIVVFDVRLFLKGAPSPEGIFRHEALHVLLKRQGESTNDARLTLGPDSDIHPDLAGMAGIAVEEYRVQRATYEQFPDDPIPSFEALCEATHDAIHEAAVAYAYDPLKNVELIHEPVMRAFAALTTQAGYIAAQVETSGLDTPSLENAELHDRLLGAPWAQAVAALRELPSATERISREAVEAAVLRVAGLFADWLRQIGFRMSLTANGQTFFHVDQHQNWFNRVPVRSETDAS